MNIKEMTDSFKRGYHRPCTMPLWKLIIVYFCWIVVAIGYIFSIHISLWFVLIGMGFQVIALHLPYKWDTESWKATKKGKDYIDKYGE